MFIDNPLWLVFSLEAGKNRAKLGK